MPEENTSILSGEQDATRQYSQVVEEDPREEEEEDEPLPEAKEQDYNGDQEKSSVIEPSDGKSSPEGIPS